MSLEEYFCTNTACRCLYSLLSISLPIEKDPYTGDIRTKKLYISRFGVRIIHEIQDVSSTVSTSHHKLLRFNGLLLALRAIKRRPLANNDTFNLKTTLFT